MKEWNAEKQKERCQKKEETEREKERKKERNVLKALCVCGCVCGCVCVGVCVCERERGTEERSNSFQFGWSFNRKKYFLTFMVYCQKMSNESGQICPFLQ